MSAPAATRFNGVVHGNTIVLERAPDLPDGQTVSVMVQASTRGEDGLKRSFGAWRDDGDALDEFLEQIRRDRKEVRTEPLP